MLASEGEPSLEWVLRDLPTTLRSRLPAGWSVEFRWEPPEQSGSRRPGPDGELIVGAPDGSQGIVQVEAKRRLDPKLVPLAVEKLAGYAQVRPATAGMVVGSFLSPRTREKLAQAGLGYADATGNLRLVLERPAVYIETQGAESDPWTRSDDRSLRSLKGPVAGRIIRTLCDFRPPFRVEQLVELSGTSLGSVARVLAFLDREALIEREPRGPVTDVKWADLLRRWAEDYAFVRSNTTRTFLEPRGLGSLLEKLQARIGPYAVTGSLAASLVAPIAAPRLATVYVDDLRSAATDLQLRQAETGANVMLAEPFDRVVCERTWRRNAVTYAALSQVVVDLLTGPGRSPAEGEELIRWMQEHEDAWRG